MIVYLLYQDNLYSLNLVNKEGIFYIIDEDKQVLLAIKAKLKKYELLKDYGYETSCEEFKEGLYDYRYLKVNGKLFITTYDKLSKMKAYHLEKGIEYYYGRNVNNHLIDRRDFISNYHFKFKYEQVFIIEDCNSLNYTFVNGKRLIKQGEFQEAMIEVLGVKLILFKDYFLVNDFIEINGLEPLISKEVFIDAYYLQPHFLAAMPSLIKALDIEMYEENKQEKGSIIYQMMLSLMMSISSLTMMMLNPNKVMLVSGGSMLLVSLSVPLMNHYYDKYREKKTLAMQKQQYLTYIEEVKNDLQMMIKEHNQLLKQRFFKYNDYDIFKHHLLMAKQKFHDDYLCLCLGEGVSKEIVDITYPKVSKLKKPALMYEDILQELEHLNQCEDMLQTIDLKKYTKIGICGKNYQAVLDKCILDLALYHRPSEVVMALFMRLDHLKQRAYLRYLPHIMHNQRLLYSGVDKLHKAMDELSKFEEVIVIIDDTTLFDDESFKAFIKAKNFLIIETNQELSLLSSDCECVIEANRECVIHKRLQQAQVINKLYQYDTAYLLQCLSHLKLKQGFNLRDDLSLFSLYQVKSVEGLEIALRQQKNRQYHSLACPIGLDEHGQIISLDIHERYDGAHGLIAGTTGSGKSQLIITYLYSLCINYHYDYVSFCIIDYKGGSLADAFKDKQRRIPHLRGSVSNLGKKDLHRSLLSLQSELEYRQRLFEQLRLSSGDSNIDIDTYQKYYAQGFVKEALPHLIIVVDEFAQLKEDYEEYLTQLVSIARIGRSLGLHLILCTQKPHGIVNQQMDSNLNFRICLKVASEEDSMEILASKQGANLTSAGQFILKSGQHLIKGQSAYMQSNQQANLAKLSLINEQGEVYDQIQLNNNLVSEQKQVLQALLVEDKVRQVFLPPLPIEVKPDKDEFYLVDDIKHQQQYRLDFDKGNYCLLGKNSSCEWFINLVLKLKAKVILFDAYHHFKTNHQYYDTYTSEEEMMQVLLDLVNKIKYERKYCELYLIISDYALFKENYPLAYDYLMYLINYGAEFACYVIIAARNTSSIPFDMLQGIKNKVCFYMEDSSEYHLVYHPFELDYLLDIDGRGYLMLDELCEFQLVGDKNDYLN